MAAAGWLRTSTTRGPACLGGLWAVTLGLERISAYEFDRRTWVGLSSSLVGLGVRGSSYSSKIQGSELSLPQSGIQHSGYELAEAGSVWDLWELLPGIWLSGCSAYQKGLQKT